MSENPTSVEAEKDIDPDGVEDVDNPESPPDPVDSSPRPEDGEQDVHQEPDYEEAESDETEAEEDPAVRQVG